MTTNEKQKGSAEKRKGNQMNALEKMRIDLEVYSLQRVLSNIQALMKHPLYTVAISSETKKLLSSTIKGRYIELQKAQRYEVSVAGLGDLINTTDIILQQLDSSIKRYQIQQIVKKLDIPQNKFWFSGNKEIIQDLSTDEAYNYLILLLHVKNELDTWVKKGHISKFSVDSLLRGHSPDALDGMLKEIENDIYSMTQSTGDDHRTIDVSKDISAIIQKHVGKFLHMIAKNPQEA